MTYNWSHWHPGYRSQCPDGRTCCERGRCFCGGRMGTGGNESPRGPETSSHLTRTHGETEKRMHHLLTMRLKRVPQPPLILCSALAHPAHAHTRTHTHTQGQGHKVVCLLQWAQEDHQYQGARGYSPAQPCSHRVTGLRAGARVSTHLPRPAPTPEPPPTPTPSLVVRNPARRSGLGRAGEVRAEGGRGEGSSSHHTSVRLTASRPLPEPRWTGIW